MIFGGIFGGGSGGKWLENAKEGTRVLKSEQTWSRKFQKGSSPLLENVEKKIKTFFFFYVKKKGFLYDPFATFFTKNFI